MDEPHMICVYYSCFESLTSRLCRLFVHLKISYVRKNPFFYTFVKVTVQSGAPSEKFDLLSVGLYAQTVPLRLPRSRLTTSVHVGSYRVGEHRINVGSDDLLE